MTLDFTSSAGQCLAAGLAPQQHGSSSVPGRITVGGADSGRTTVDDCGRANGTKANGGKPDGCTADGEKNSARAPVVDDKEAQALVEQLATRFRDTQELLNKAQE